MPNFTLAPVLFAAAWLMLSGFTTEQAPPGTGQPADERKAQEALPQSHDDMWTALGRCKVHLNHKTYMYSIDYTAAVKAMENTPVTISGFMMPLESTETFSHFLLSKRTPTCPFCPPGEPNEIVEIFTKKPLKWDEGLIVVTGTMKFTKNPELGLFFQLKDTTQQETKPYGMKNASPPV